MIKLVLKLCKYKVQKQYFCNSLPVVSAGSISCFKRRLDMFCCNLSLYYDYKFNI